MIEKLQDTHDLYCISGEGALLLFLPHSLCRQWSGVSVPTDRQIEAEFRWAGPGTPATDYDRACDIKGYIETIVVGKIGKYNAATLERTIEDIPILAHRLILQQD